MLVIRKQRLLNLPNPDKTNISDSENWLYVNPEDREDDNVVAGAPMEADAPTRERVVPPPHSSHHHGAGSSSMGQDCWGWMETEMGYLYAEQSR